MKKLEGEECLGLKMAVRRPSEESLQTSARAAAIAVAAMQEL